MHPLRDAGPHLRGMDAGGSTCHRHRSVGVECAAQAANCACCSTFAALWFGPTHAQCQGGTRGWQHVAGQLGTGVSTHPLHHAGPTPKCGVGWQHATGTMQVSAVGLVEYRSRTMLKCAPLECSTIPWAFVATFSARPGSLPLECPHTKAPTQARILNPPAAAPPGCPRRTCTSGRPAALPTPRYTSLPPAPTPNPQLSHLLLLLRAPLPVLARRVTHTSSPSPNTLSFPLASSSNPHSAHLLLLLQASYTTLARQVVQLPP